MSKMRNIAAILGRTEAANIDNSPGVDIDDNIADSSVVSSILAGSTMAVYSSVDSLPGSPTAGSQAFVTGNQRLYTARNSAVGSGWYNVALINATPTLSLSASGTIALTAGSPTTITMTAADSDNSNTNLTLTLESGGDLFKFATVSQDSSVVTITPRSEDSATALGSDGSATLTFKASDGISQATVQNTFTLAFTPVGADWSGTETQQKLTASDPGADHSLGEGATMSADGNYAVVGAYYWLPSGLSTPLGKAYVYLRTGNTWAQQATLSPTGGNEAQGTGYFGFSVALDATGTRVAVGMRYGETGTGSGNYNQGCVFVFKRTGTSWAQETFFQASDKATQDQFGINVDINGDGDYIAVGAYKHSHSSISEAGAAYVFTRSGTTWSQQAKLVASNAAAEDFFGESITISKDNNYIAVGAPGHDNGGGYTGAGAVYVFVRSGTSWSQQAFLQHSDKAYGDEGGRGHAVDLSDDGEYLIFGTKRKPYANANGAAYIFLRTGTNWAQQAKLVSSDLAANDFFGYACRLSGGGDRAVVGAPRETTGSTTNNGAVYIFSRSGTSWSQSKKLLASDKSGGEQVGSSIGISDTSGRIVSGAPFDDDNSLNNSGSVYFWYV